MSYTVRGVNYPWFQGYCQLLGKPKLSSVEGCGAVIRVFCNVFVFWAVYSYICLRSLSITNWTNWPVRQLVVECMKHMLYRSVWKNMAEFKKQLNAVYICFWSNMTRFQCSPSLALENSLPCTSRVCWRSGFEQTWIFNLRRAQRHTNWCPNKRLMNMT